MSGLLQIENLLIGYDKALTNHINLTANAGDIICVVGRNGIGKSTLLNTLAGVIKPIEGNCYIKGKEINKIKHTERSSVISYVTSRLDYLSNFKIFDLVAIGRSPYTNIFDKRSEKDIEIIHQYLKDFEISYLKDKPLYSVSDGERQRAMICRAFVQETPVILLDEPTAFLDYYSKNKLLQKLSELAIIDKKCIVFSSHDLEIAFKFVSKIWLFDKNNVGQFELEDLKSGNILETAMSFKFNQTSSHEF
ncbi:MAG: ABC transporter ATP-binding protein [Bacteroidales bacterium]|nr:ABC transporter ATP-binding protein [Bacteroidales bacterium]